MNDAPPSELHLEVIGDTIYIVASGPFDMETVRTIIERLEATEADLERPLHRLADLRGISVPALGFAELEPLARLRKRTLERASQPIKLALVVDAPLKFGLARMYQMLLAESSVEIEIFEELGPAAAWLGVDEDLLPR